MKKFWIRQRARLPPHVCAMVISTETEMAFIAEKSHVSNRSHSSLPEVDKNPVNTIYSVGLVVGVLMNVDSLYQRQPVVSEWFPLISADIWNVVSGVKSMREAFLIRRCYSYICTILAVICILGTSCPSPVVDSSCCYPLSPISNNYYITPIEVTADTPARKTCFSECLLLFYHCLYWHRLCF